MDLSPWCPTDDLLDGVSAACLSIPARKRPKGWAAAINPETGAMGSELADANQAEMQA